MGKVIATGSFCAFGDQMVRDVLRAKLVLKTERDVKVLVVGEAVLTLPVLERETLHAASLTMPITLVARRIGFYEFTDYDKLALYEAISPARQIPGSGLFLRQGFCPVIGDRLVQFVMVEPGEPFDHFAPQQMLLDEFRDVIDGHAGIPGSVRMNDHVGSVAAGSERTARGDMNLALQLAPRYFGAEFLQNLLGATRSAATLIIGLAVGADKNVMAKRQHGLLLPN
jgi:hypothetical protein